MKQPDRMLLEAETRLGQAQERLRLLEENSQTSDESSMYRGKTHLTETGDYVNDDGSPAIVLRGIKRIRAWYNRALVVRIKALIITTGILLGLVFAFQWQIDSINHDRAVAQCLSRKAAANESRGVLLQIVDLSDIIPEGTEVSQPILDYIANRQKLINDTYDKIIASVPGC